MAPLLASGDSRMDLFVAKLKNAFVSLIEELDGDKVIVWGQELVGPATLLTKMSRLKELGVQSSYALNNEFYKNLNVKHIIFVVRPYLTHMDLIANYVHECTREDHHLNLKRDLRIIFIPRVTQMCKRRLEERGVLGSLELRSAESDLFPFDTDLLSMELEHTFRDFVLDDDHSSLENVAAALRGLETEFGPIPHIIGRGRAAKIVTDCYTQLAKHDRGKSISVPSSLNLVILLDRQVDLITPIATQLTYEGLIDEMFSLNNTMVTFPPERFTTDEEITDLSSSKKKLVVLNSSDDLYVELRDKNFNGIGPALKRKAQSVAAQLEQRHSKSIDTMRTFVSQLPQLQATKRSLATHTTIAELIKEKTEQGCFLNGLEAEQELLCGIETDKVHPYIDDSISRKAPILKVMRLICIQSLANGGLKPRVLEHYKREIIQTYGLKYIMPFSHLDEAGLLCVQSNPRHYAALKRTLKLIIEDDSEIDPTDICFTHSVYAPLSIRLLQHYKSWNTMRDIMDMVPGPTVDCFFGQSNDQKDDRQRILVFFLGGCTYAEVSALRFLSQKDDATVDYIIATTKLINGNTFLSSIMGVSD